MDPAEVVVGEVQAIRGPEVLPLLRERIRQPREAPHLHSDREVLTLDMAGANLRGIGVSHDWDLLRVRDIGRAIPALAFRVLGVDLDELRKVASVAQCGRNRTDIGLESIGADLEVLRCGCGTQALYEGVCGRLATSRPRAKLRTSFV